jgi:hypothetical protein
MENHLIPQINKGIICHIKKMPVVDRAWWCRAGKEENTGKKEGPTF